MIEKLNPKLKAELRNHPLMPCAALKCDCQVMDTRLLKGQMLTVVFVSECDLPSNISSRTRDILERLSLSASRCQLLEVTRFAVPAQLQRTILEIEELPWSGRKVFGVELKNGKKYNVMVRSDDAYYCTNLPGGLSSSQIVHIIPESDDLPLADEVSPSLCIYR